MGRIEFELNDLQWAELYEAATKPLLPTANLALLDKGITIFETPTRQFEVSRVWKKLGPELGIKWVTAKRSPNKGERVFNAEPL